MCMYIYICMYILCINSVMTSQEEHSLLVMYFILLMMLNIKLVLVGVGG
jgi:hypothetical protein